MTPPGAEVQKKGPIRDLAIVPEAARQLAESEMVPAVLTIETGGANVSIPVGAYTLRQGRVCFVPTVDLDGLTAITLGIGLGWFTIHRISPIFRAWARRISR
jgi:hypothetical protein